MPLMHQSSPHIVDASSRTNRVMRQVILACMPALVVMTYYWGFGNLWNVMWCAGLALALEAGCLKLRQRPIAFYLRDGSALVTGLLLGLALSPLAPWWLSLVGMIAAIPVAKHLYGGLGQNPFNPAMVAYALLLVSFPVEMTRWPSAMLSFDINSTSFLGLHTQTAIDHLTGATPLDAFKTHHTSNALTYGLRTDWLAVNIAFLLGGLYLLARRIIHWQIPVAMLGTLSVFASLFYAFNTSLYASPLLHLMSGATMLGAFFIATDPVTAPSAKHGQLLYGVGIGLLIYVIRTWGGYPDAVAFAVLLMNLVAPTIDLWQPRTFGQPVRWRGGK